MTSTETSSVGSLVSSLVSSFKLVPPAAIPPMLDCILASTGSSASAIFFSLLDLSKDAIKEGQKLDSDQCNYIASMVGALCHLLKTLGANHDAFQSFMWKSFIPLMKMRHAFEPEMLNQVEWLAVLRLGMISESFFDVVTKTNTWINLEKTLVPCIFSSVGCSLGVLQNEESDAIEWVSCSPFQGSKGETNASDMDKECMLSLSRSITLPTSCHILTLVMDSALRNLQAAPSTDSLLENGCYAEKFAANLLWKCFFKKIWKCCRTLFSLGTLERRDAFTVLSLYLSHSSYTEGSENSDRSDRGEEFDIRAVDEEGLVRKQSLHILKAVLQIRGENQGHSGVSDMRSQGKNSTARGMTKRDLWAVKEAKSLGVGKLCYSTDLALKQGQQQWEAFILLYEMLEEYGTHLVEAAWNHQITLLLQFSLPHDNLPGSTGRAHQNWIKPSGEIFDWLSVLWERGFCHGNPQVRYMIMQSFLGIEWKSYENCAKSVPESFVLGPFMEGLNDPVHHKDFGTKGVYSSRTIERAASFLHQYASFLDTRKQIAFLSNLASVAKQQSFGRVGLMALAECIASAACGVAAHIENKAECCGDAFPEKVPEECSPENFPCNDKSDLLDILRFVIESSKQHFNPNYRLRVCEKVLEAAASLMCTFEVPLEILLHFISALPREFTDYGGSLRARVREWLSGCSKQQSANNCKSRMLVLKSLNDFPISFTSHPSLSNAFVTCDDEDLDSWESKAKRWARVFFLVIKDEQDLAPVLKFIQNGGINICKQSNHVRCISMKFLILTLNFLQEIQIMQERYSECGIRIRTKSEIDSLKTVDQFSYAEASIFHEKLANLFPNVLEELVCFSNLSCSIFLSNIAMEETNLPSSVIGKLGGPSQRRLSFSTTTVVLQAVRLPKYFFMPEKIMSVKAVASISSWCARLKRNASIEFAYDFMWNLFWKTIQSPTSDSETGAEVCLAAYEALASALKALVGPQALCFFKKNDKLMLSAVEGKPLLDSWVQAFLQNINALLAAGVLARARRAILLNWKWLCLESLLSLPYCGLENGANCSYFFSDDVVRYIFNDLVESLENAGEGSLLPMLRSVRLTLDLFASGSSGSLVSSCRGVDTQMMWHLVRSSWILHISCNKRRVAPIAALLSSVLHYSVFSEEEMHMMENTPGPLKWFVEKVLEEGTKSPRTIRLAALHLTGLWLTNPWIIKYYIKELKLLTLYGSVAFDEDFEAELAENYDAKTEVSLLAKSPVPELTELADMTLCCSAGVWEIGVSQLYARVSVAVLFSKLADLTEIVGSAKECQDALDSGKLLLLGLLDFVAGKTPSQKINTIILMEFFPTRILVKVNDKDLARELYKKYSARNNLPSVRQYLETFAITIYLKFPSLVAEQLVPILRDYDMRPQALSSYVFIAANVILHASKAVQFRHLEDLLPPIVPLLTSHHHSLRGFTQLLVYQVLCKLFPTLDFGTSQKMPLEKSCFEDLKSYLAKNSDCTRLRASMSGYLDAYDPNLSITPAVIFVNRDKELEFECVPTSLMEQVLNFLNDVREDLRYSMAKDVVTIKNESLKIGEDPDCAETLSDLDKEESFSQLPKDSLLDFQKKITLPKHENQDNSSSSFFGNREAYKQLLEIEKEDELFDQVLQARSLAMETIRASRQQFVLVASLIDRIPNLAGLARTCEVFKASGLAIADANILHDKQFQLISVTAEKWVPIVEVPVNSIKHFLERKKHEGFSVLGLEQTANSIPLDQYMFPKKTVLVLGREKEGIPVDIIHMLDACIEIPQLGVVRSLNVHVSGAIALWEYTRQQRF
ncbi:hypothetical protein WN943_013631 [Citrus x changshan-huyou]